MKIEKIIIKSVKKIYKNNKIFLHEPSIDKTDQKSLNLCIKSKFVSTVGKGVDEFEKKLQIHKYPVCTSFKQWNFLLPYLF